MRHYYRFGGPFALERGGVLPDLEIVYHTYGRMNDDRSNVVWVCHALTANSDVADWWPGTVCEGGILDPERWFVICANVLGSPYGSTGPMSINPASGKPWYGDFPRLTIRDMVRAHSLLADALGIERVHTLVGSSVGGFQAIEWAVSEPDRFGRLALIATEAKASPWAIALDETQRMAITADATWGEPRADAAQKGLAAARAIGLLSYRGPSGYNLTQQDHEDPSCDAAGIPEDHRACTYQRHQGDKLVRRFDAYSYMTTLDAFDTHDAGRGRGGIAAALGRITARTVVVGLTTDIIFLPEDMRRLASMIHGARYAEIASPFGHDGFLVEAGKLREVIAPLMEN